MSGAYESDQGRGAPASGMPTLADALRLLRRRARIIAGVAILGTAAGFGLGLMLTPVYEGIATVEIDSRRTNISNIEDVVTQLDPDSPTIDSQIEIIQSARIAGRVVDQLQLSKDLEFQAQPGWRTTIKDKLKRLFGWAETSPSAESVGTGWAGAEEADLIAVQALRSRISAERVGGSFLIEVTVKSWDADKAALIANAVVEAYIDEQVQAKAKQAQQATLWLDRQAAELKQKVVDAERLVEAYKIENGLQSTEGHPLEERELTRAAEQLIVSRSEAAGARARYEQMQSLAATREGQETIAAVLTSDTVTELKTDLARVTRKHAELSARYGELHPLLIEAKAEMRDAYDQLNGEIAMHIANLRNEYEVAEGRVASLEQSLEDHKAVANASSEASVKLRELARDADAARTVYETLLKRAAETRQQETLQVPDARIVNPAITPFSPASPKKLKLALFGFAAGFGLAFVLSALFELIWPTFVRPQEIEARLRLRVLSSVPQLPLPPHDEATNDIRSIVVAPHTPFAESVRAVRIAVDTERRAAAEVVLVASALPGDGKTLIASNLAHLYALSGVKTLLIDADLRKGLLTRQLLPEGDLGLLDCLQAGLEPRQAIVSERTTGLNFLPATGVETSRMSAPELLSSRRMAEVFSSLRHEFEVIILDAPPVMPVVDARVLAEHADQIVLVSRWQRSPNGLVRRAGELLALSGAAMTGVVINGVEDSALPADNAYMLRGYGDTGRLRRAA